MDLYMTIFEDPRDTTGVFRYFPVYNFKPDTDTLEKLKGRGCRFIFADLKLSLGVEDARNLIFTNLVNINFSHDRLFETTHNL